MPIITSVTLTLVIIMVKLPQGVRGLPQASSGRCRLRAWHRERITPRSAGTSACGGGGCSRSEHHESAPLSPAPSHQRSAGHRPHSRSGAWSWSAWPWRRWGWQAFASGIAPCFTVCHTCTLARTRRLSWPWPGASPAQTRAAARPARAPGPPRRASPHGEQQRDCSSPASAGGRPARLLVPSAASPRVRLLAARRAYLCRRPPHCGP